MVYPIPQLEVESITFAIHQIYDLFIIVYSEAEDPYNNYDIAPSEHKVSPRLNGPYIVRNINNNAIVSPPKHDIKESKTYYDHVELNPFQLRCPSPIQTQKAAADEIDSETEDDYGVISKSSSKQQSKKDSSYEAAFSAEKKIVHTGTAQKASFGIPERSSVVTQPRIQRDNNSLQSQNTNLTEMSEKERLYFSKNPRKVEFKFVYASINIQQYVHSF